MLWLKKIEMALKDILSIKSGEPNEYFWAIAIEPGWVQAGLWGVKENKAEIISVSPPSAWKLDEELVNAVDSALTASIQNFPEDTPEPSKAVFGIRSGWAKDGEIDEVNIDKIKKICSKLSLSPVGFVVLPEAISYYYKSEEGVPLSAIVLGISKDEIELSVFRLGKLLGTAGVARSLSSVDDIVEGLTRIAGNADLPSRMILYNGKEEELEEIKQTLLKANWDDFSKIKFLHTPKVEFLSPDKKIHAVALAGASELADVTTLYSKKEKEVPEEDELENVVEPKESISPQSFGFAVGEDVLKGKKPVADTIVSSDTPPEPEEKPKRAEKKPSPGFIMTIKSFIQKIKPSSDSIRIGKGEKFGKRTLVYGVIFFALILAAFFAFYWLYPKATVTIYVSSKRLEERVGIIVDSKIENPNLEENILPGEVFETTTDGDRTTQTTGTKTVGENAKGEVTLYRVGSEITLSSGTIIIGPGNLQFSLRDDVTVSSGSASTPGTTKTSIAASSIGAEYNLAGGTSFSVSNYSPSDIEAKNESAFSGGSSREISAVSVEDQEELEQELIDELKDKARKEFNEIVAGNKFLIEETLTSTPSSRTFSDKVGDEAETLKLTLSLSTTVLIIDEEALYSLAEEVLKDSIPEGFVLRSEQISTEFEYQGEVDGRYELETKISANLLPEIDPDKIKEQIIGKYPALVRNYLIDDIPGFSRAEISFNKPKFPGKLGTLPRLKKNIEVEIAKAE
jgi:hypothetical protein